MARVDWAVSRGEKGEKRRLRAREVEDHLMPINGAYLLEVVPPEFARIPAKLVSAFFLQLAHRADDIFGGERLAVMPLHVIAQFERELGLCRIPRPARGQFWSD